MFYLEELYIKDCRFINGLLEFVFFDFQNLYIFVIEGGFIVVIVVDSMVNFNISIFLILFELSGILNFINVVIMGGIFMIGFFYFLIMVNMIIFENNGLILLELLIFFQNI